MRIYRELVEVNLRGDTYLPVADPGFPRGGAPTLGGGGGGAPTQHTILPNFPQNCMKLKEFGPGGARPKFYYEDPPLPAVVHYLTSESY